jgi:4-amino-4-deoxy-L-arabinose transferase-like glycosyltransferase
MKLFVRFPDRAVAALILAVFAIVATTYSVTVPLMEAPDELGHFGYVLTIARDGRLPVQWTDREGSAHQPPLYYAIAALAVLPIDLTNNTTVFRYNRFLEGAGMGGHDKNYSLHSSAETFPYEGTALALHVARLISVAMATGTVAFTIAIGWALFPQRRAIGLLAGALVAFNPQFIFMNSAVNDDTLNNLAAAAALWQMLQTIRQPDRARLWLFTGAWLAVGILAKLNIVSVVGVVGVALIYSAWRRRSWRGFLRNAVALAAVPLLTTTWWFARNLQIYGDLLGMNGYRQMFAWAFRQSPLQWSDVVVFLRYEVRSFWALFGWTNVWAPEWVYLLGSLILLAGLIGLVVWLLRRQYRSMQIDEKAGLALLALAAVAHQLYMTIAITQMGDTWYQGRYYFPAIAPLMTLVSLGIITLLPRRMEKPFGVALPVVMLGTSLFALFGVITPAYNIVPAPKWSLWLAPNKLDLSFGNALELKGYSADVDRTAGQTRIHLALYWRRADEVHFDYSSFAHVLDAGGQMVAQADQAPGQPLGYPPTAWLPGDIIIDRRTIDLPANTTGSFRVRLGVYNYLTGERLMVSDRGAPAGDFIVLEQPIDIH